MLLEVINEPPDAGFEAYVELVALVALVGLLGFGLFSLGWLGWRVDSGVWRGSSVRAAEASLAEGGAAVPTRACRGFHQPRAPPHRQPPPNPRAPPGEQGGPPQHGALRRGAGV